MVDFPCNAFPDFSMFSEILTMSQFVCPSRKGCASVSFLALPPALLNVSIPLPILTAPFLLLFGLFPSEPYFLP